MKRKIVWLMVSGLMVLALVLASCGPAVTEEEEEEVTEEEEEGVAEEEEEGEEGPEMASISLTKLDGAAVTKLKEKPKYGGTFTWINTADPTFWDDASGGGSIRYVPNELIYERLMGNDWTRGPSGTGEISMIVRETIDPKWTTGMLAESWEMPDDETIIVYLRQGVKFHDKEPKGTWSGREMTAEDYAYSYTRVMFGPTSWHRFTYSDEQRDAFSATAIDKYTVEVKWMKGRVGEVVRIGLDYVNIVPKDLVEEFGDLKDPMNQVGTGAFMFTDYISGSSMTFVRNPNYWGTDPFFPDNTLPYLDGIKILIIPDKSTYLTALRTGKIDSLYYVTAQDTEALLKTNPELEHKKSPANTTPIVEFRVDTPGLPFYDKRVRQALQMATDLEEIKNTFYLGEAAIKPQPIMDVPEFQPLLLPLNEMPENIQELFTYNPEKARQLLAEAGYPDGFKATATLYAPQEELLSIVVSYWAKVGVDVKLDMKELGAFYGMWVQHTVPELMLFSFIDDTPRSMNNWRPANIMNQGDIIDPVLDKAYADVEINFFDMDEIGRIYRELTLYVLDQAWNVVLPTPYNWVLWQPWVKGYAGELSTGCWDLYKWMRFLWIDQDLKEEMTGRR
jgi:peptide/nickel transport system substrate-binding protein